MAGQDPRFNADRFKEAILFAMHMGLPEDASERVTFKWTTQKTYQNADPAGRPYSWTTPPATVTSHADVQVDVAIEFQSRPAGTRDTQIGQFDTSRAILTLLEAQYDQVRGADIVEIDGNVYDVQLVAPPIGLFEVTVYQIYCEARDES